MIEPEKADDERLCAAGDAVEDTPRDLGLRWFRDEDDGARLGVAVERLDRREGREAADFGAEVAAADADRVRDALAGSRDETGDFLQTGARGRDDTDVAARTAMTRSFAPAARPRSPSRPASSIRRLLLTEPIINAASSTPGSAAMVCASRISAAESM
jgi:hypothetical protein